MTRQRGVSKLSFRARLWAWLDRRRHTPYTIARRLRSCGAAVGDACFIVPTDLEEQIAPARLRIGNHVAIAAGVTIAQQNAANHSDGAAAPPLYIHDNCFIGFRSILYPGVEIGPGSIVGAGSIVMSDVPPNTIVIGTPARPFGSIDRYREKCLRRWVEQKPPGAVIDPGETWWSGRHSSSNREQLRVHLATLFRDDLSSVEPSDSAGLGNRV